MPPQAVLVLVLTILPLLWLASEFSSSRPLRISLEIGALLMSFGVAFVVGSLQQLNDNAWYGTASKRLIDATVAQSRAATPRACFPN